MLALSGLKFKKINFSFDRQFPLAKEFPFILVLNNISFYRKKTGKDNVFPLIICSIIYTGKSQCAYKIGPKAWNWIGHKVVSAQSWLNKLISAGILNQI